MIEYCDLERWHNARGHQQDKWNNEHHIVTFNHALSRVTPPDGMDVVYHKYDKRNYRKGLVHFVESSPVFYLFRLSPRSYYLDNFRYDDAWKKSRADHSYIDYFRSINTNKYSQKSTQTSFNFEYILFPLQSDPWKIKRTFDLDRIIDCMNWANENKRHVVYKLHPFSTPQSHIPRYFDMLEERGIMGEYNSVVSHESNIDYLIDHASAVWTFSSGAGFQALVKGKPVAHFHEDVDFKNITLFAKSAEHAAMAKAPSDDDLAKYLTWYYETLSIDATTKDLAQRIQDRLHLIHRLDYDVRKIF